MWAAVVLLVLLIPLIAVISDSPLGRALASRLERRDPDADGALARRIASLETEVERLAADVERIEEGTRFLERLLEQRSGAVKELRSGEPDG